MSELITSAAHRVTILGRRGTNQGLHSFKRRSPRQADIRATALLGTDRVLLRSKEGLRSAQVA